MPLLAWGKSRPLSIGGATCRRYNDTRQEGGTGGEQDEARSSRPGVRRGRRTSGSKPGERRGRQRAGWAGEEVRLLASCAGRECAGADGCRAMK
jgi:hypothetical protein